MANRINCAAFDLARDLGLSSLSSRRLAEAAGVSLSAIPYYIGSMADVRQAVAMRAHEELTKWRASRLDMSSQGLAFTTAAGLVTSVIADAITTRRGLSLLETELQASDLSDGFFSAEAEAGTFWQERICDLGEPEGIATSWTDFLFGLKSLALIDADPGSVWTWVPPLIRRFADRIAGREIFQADELTFPAPETYKTEPPATGGAQRILDATIALIGESGVESLTHRNVAAKAGLSVASCRFFFGTKSEMIRAAVLELERRMHDRLSRRLDTWDSGNPLLISAIKQNENFIALNSLHAPVARDPMLRSVARVLRDFRGAHAWERLKQSYPSADRIDAIIWSTSYIGALHPQRLPSERTDEALQHRLGLHYDNLFHGGL